MKKITLLLSFIIIVVSCQKPKTENIQTTEADSTITATQTDTSSVDNLLKKMQEKPLPANYSIVGNVQTAVLQFSGFQFGDMAHFHFRDEAGRNYDFNGNETPYNLNVESLDQNEDNGGYEPNKEYLNKKFRVVWRKIKLNHEPKDETEMYYQEYDEIIYLEKLD